MQEKLRKQNFCRSLEKTVEKGAESSKELKFLNASQMDDSTAKSEQQNIDINTHTNIAGKFIVQHRIKHRTNSPVEQTAKLKYGH